MSFPRTFFDLISIVKKSTLFARTFFDVISMVGKSTLLPFTFFHVVTDRDLDNRDQYQDCTVSRF